MPVNYLTSTFNTTATTLAILSSSVEALRYPALYLATIAPFISLTGIGLVQLCRLLRNRLKKLQKREGDGKADREGSPEEMQEVSLSPANQAGLASPLLTLPADDARQSNPLLQSHS